MAKQPVPSVSDRDVERIVRRDFEAARVAEVLVVLDEYGKESWQREPARVCLAALRLASGCIDEAQRIMSNDWQHYQKWLER